MANVWKQFQSLIDIDAVYVVEVISVDTETVIVELLSGDRLRVRIGTGGSPGDKVLIKAGEIIQKVSGITQYNMVLY